MKATTKKQREREKETDKRRWRQKDEEACRWWDWSKRHLCAMDTQNDRQIDRRKERGLCYVACLSSSKTFGTNFPLSCLSSCFLLVHMLSCDCLALWFVLLSCFLCLSVSILFLFVNYRGKETKSRRQNTRHKRERLQAFMQTSKQAVCKKNGFAKNYPV